MQASATQQSSQTEPAVSIRGLRQQFGAVSVLDGLDLDIAPGEFVALLGHSGARQDDRRCACLQGWRG